MATRVPRNNITFRLVGIPPEVDPKELKRILGEAVAELSAKAAPTVATPKVVLRNRHLRKADAYPCRREPSALWSKAIIWPAGVPHKGCGRSFASEKRRDLHEAGTSWNPIRFPHGCLDAIVPANLRDDR